MMSILSRDTAGYRLKPDKGQGQEASDLIIPVIYLLISFSIAMDTQHRIQPAAISVL